MISMVSTVVSGTGTVGSAVGTAIASAVFGLPFMLLGIFVLPSSRARSTPR